MPCTGIVRWRETRSFASGADDGRTPVRPLVGAGASMTALPASSSAPLAGDALGTSARILAPRLPSDATTNAPTTKPSSPLARRYRIAGRGGGVVVIR